MRELLNCNLVLKKMASLNKLIINILLISYYLCNAK